MLLFVVGAILLTERRRTVAGSAAWAASAFIKASAIALLPIEFVALLRRDRRAIPIWCASLVVAAAVFGGLAALLYGTAWPSFIRRASAQLSQTSSLSLVFRLGQLGVSRQIAKVVLAVVFVLGYGKLLLDAWRTGRARLAFASTLLIFTPAWLVPWYGSWPVALAATEDDHIGEALALIATAYLLTDALPLPYI